MLENVKLAFQGILGHKLRSLLTMLGIIIGIASIITIVSTIKGTNEQIKENVIGSGTNAVIVQLYQDDYPYDLQYMSIPDGVSVITEDTRKQLEDIRGAEGASLFHSREYVDGIAYGAKSFSGALYGIDEYYLDVCGYELCYGREIVPSDYENNVKVCLIDTKTAADLLPGMNPLGETIDIRGVPFTIVGVLSKTSDFEPTINTISDYYSYTDTSGGSIFIPDAVWAVAFRFDEPLSAAIKAQNTDDMTDIGKKAADILTQNHVSGSESNLSYRSADLLEQAKQLQSLSATTNMQLLWIASISLLVGGIGVMNIMLVSVTERTSEIGLKKAIGAKKRRILWQFLTEAAVLTSLGGIIGVIAGIIMALLISQIMGTPSSISVPATILAVAFSMLIGILFGMIPAIKASNLNPIEALRRE